MSVLSVRLMLSSLVVASIGAATTPGLAKQLCHDEQQLQCVKPNRSHHPWPRPCLQTAMVTVQVCKTVVDVNPATISRPAAARGNSKGDPKLRTHW
jgi:hypothetical protein